MSNADLIAAANAAAAILVQIDGDVWAQFTCAEIDAVADLMRAAGRKSDAASVLVWHASADTEDNGDDHAEIGAAARAQADVRGIAWADREAYKLAVAYVRDMF